MEFRILGPVEIIAGSDRLELGGTRQQIVLAALLLNANRVVSTDRLLEAIYGEDLPPTSRSQAQISISWLRRVFAGQGAAEVIATHPQGYLIKVSQGQLDSQRFEELAAAAALARESGQFERAVANYRDALRLWRGPALEGIDSQLLRAAAQRLDEQRIGISEDRFALELELGRHHELVGELTEVVQEFPLREMLRNQLMLALYRCGRTAEALAVYQDFRRAMVDELGIDPGEQLKRLERAILNSDPVLDLPARAEVRAAKPQVPNLLPIDIADFTGRKEHISQVYRHLVPPEGDAPRLAVPVVVMVGKGGVGKTSVAVHAAHILASHFPDGQLFADLHGATAYPVNPMQLLERFLRALGVTGSHIPEGLDERAEVYRNLLASRRVLVLLDDATNESQVSPLLPGTGAAGVIITSRRRLAGLAGAVRIEVNVFESVSSIDLLARIAGAARVQAELAASATIAEHCGHLPLALRIAGARLAARPHRSIQELVDRLADETQRLDELRHGDVGIRTSISFTYESTSAVARRLFRLLALLEVPLFSGWVCSALLDQPLRAAEDLLDELVSAQLVETVGSERGAGSQYRFHDLIRVFARERLAAEEPTAERKGALRRALGALLNLAEKANSRHYGGEYLALRSEAPRWPLPERLSEQLVSDPLSWYERERATLVSGVRQAAAAGFVELSWSLALSAVTLFESRVYLDDWRQTNIIALEACQRAQHVRGQGAMLYSIGSLNIAQQRYEEARQALTEAAQLFTDAADDAGTALVTRHIATIDRLSGHLTDATARYEQALTIFRRIGDHIAAAYVLHMMAQINLELHDVGRAKELLSEALRLCQLAPCLRVEAQVLHRLGETCLMSGDVSEAVAMFGCALEKTRQIGDTIGESYALCGLGLANTRNGDLGPAREALHRSLELARGVGERMAEARALVGLAKLALTADDPGQAITLGQLAADAFQKMGTPLEAAHALTLLSEAESALGNADAASAALAQAAALREEI